LLLGYAWQQGWIPLAHQSLTRAIELNGVMVENNLRAFEWGRAAAHHGAQAILPHQDATVSTVPEPESLEALIDHQAQCLSDYQNAAYAGRYRVAVNRIRQAEAALSASPDLPLTRAVAINLARLM